MPKYRYALNDRGLIADVVALVHGTAESRGPFLCVGCEQPLIAKIVGRERTKHFAHKVVVPSCSMETYLHRLAKKAFLEVYSKCLALGEPFFVELSHPQYCARYKAILGKECRLPDSLKLHNLTRYYNRIRLETRDGKFVPDLLLYNSAVPEKKIYVEMAVTHALSDAKSGSGHRIIEIPIGGEGDIEKFAARRLSESDARFIGFPRRDGKAEDDECPCASQRFFCLLVYKNGKSVLLHTTIDRKEAECERLKEQLKAVRFVKPSERLHTADPGIVYRALVREAAARGIAIRNCFLCRYAGINFNTVRGRPVFCKYLKVACGSNRAADCSHYRLPPKDMLPPQRPESRTQARVSARRSGAHPVSPHLGIFPEWRRVLERVTVMDGDLAVTLSAATPITYKDSVLTLRFSNRDQYIEIGDPDTRLWLECLIAQLVGFEVFLLCELVSTATS